MNATEKKVADFLFARGWTVVDKIGGTAISAGFPDLWTYHPDLGGRWAEVKTHGDKLTAPQWHRLDRWTRKGCPAWVLTDRDPDPAAVLRGPPNLEPWLARGPKRRRMSRSWVDAKRRMALESGGQREGWELSAPGQRGVRASGAVRRGPEPDAPPPLFPQSRLVQSR